MDSEPPSYGRQMFLDVAITMLMTFSGSSVSTSRSFRTGSRSVQSPGSKMHDVFVYIHDNTTIQMIQVGKISI